MSLFKNHLASGFLERVPIPEHGASIKILSKCDIKLGFKSRKHVASALRVFTEVKFNLSKFDCIIFNLLSDLSTASISALSFVNSAKWVDLLPGAAQASNIFSPFLGFKRGATH